MTKNPWNICNVLQVRTITPRIQSWSHVWFVPRLVWCRAHTGTSGFHLGGMVFADGKNQPIDMHGCNFGNPGGTTKVVKKSRRKKEKRVRKKGQERREETKRKWWAGARLEERMRNKKKRWRRNGEGAVKRSKKNYCGFVDQN